MCVWLVATVPHVYAAVYSRCIWRWHWKICSAMLKTNWTTVKILWWPTTKKKRKHARENAEYSEYWVTKTTDYLRVHQCCSWLTAGQYWSANPAQLLCRPIPQPRVCFEVLLDAVLAARGESGARVKERGFVLIIHRYRLTDRSQHAALWARAPAYRAQKKGGVREAVVG